MFVHWLTGELDSKFLSSTECIKMIETATGYIRDQGEHDLCWAYVVCDMVSASLVLHGWKKIYTPLSQLYLCQNVDKAQYGQLLTEDSDRQDDETHSCYMHYISPTLKFVEDNGVPEAIPMELGEIFNCNIERPVSASDHMHHITGSFRYPTLQEALERLRTHPVAATLTCFGSWEGPGIYRGPKNGDLYVGSHSVLMLDCRMVDGTMVVRCKSSNGEEDIGNKGYLYVSVEVMLAQVGVARRKDSEFNCPIQPQYLLSEFYSVDMDMSPNPLFQETAEERSKNLKYKVDFEKEEKDLRDGRRGMCSGCGQISGMEKNHGTFYSRKRPTFDVADVFLWLMAVCTIFGAYWFAWEEVIDQHKLLKVGSDELSTTVISAILFLVVASCVQIILYKLMSCWFIQVFCIAVVEGVETCLVALLSRFRHFGKQIAVMWAVKRHFSFAWIRQDILGIISLITTLVQIVRVPNLKVGIFLLCCALVYNIFWGGFSVIGFGDIILPGLLVAFALRYGWLTNKKLKSGCFLGAMSAYCLGLLIAHIALNLMGGHGKPALIYIVPFILGTLMVLGHKNLKSGYYFLGGYDLDLVLAYMSLNLMDEHGKPALLYIVPIILGILMVLGHKRGHLKTLWTTGEP